MWGFTVRGRWRPNINCNILTPTLMAVIVVSFSFSRCSTGGPALCWMMTFFTASYQQLLWTPTRSGAPSPFGLVWLSLPHLVYNFVRSLTATVWPLSWLSYIIVQHPLSRLLDFRNRMLDRHQAEITAMQFTGHSVPVHQPMSVLREFFLPRPISSANFRPRDFHS